MIGLVPWMYIGPFTFELLVTLFLKASLVLLLTGILLLFLQGASSSKRSAGWSLGLGALILLPFISIFFPSWQIYQHRLLGPTAPGLTAGSAAGTLPTAAAAAGPEQIAETATTMAAGSSAPTGELAAVIILLIWLGGTGYLISRLIIHSMRARRLTSQAEEISDPALISLARELKERIGLKSEVRIVAGDTPGIPFSWGIRRPVVVFPADAVEWDREQQRSVLLHEFAHIARYDHVVHLVIETVRALYWMNPFIWYAIRRNAIERERACDDFALLNGTRSDTYATHLLSIARSQLGLCAPAGVATMAGGSGLFERVRSIMDSRQDRSPIPRQRLLPAASVALLMVVPLATFNLAGSQMSIPTVEQCVRDLRSEEDPVLRRQAAWWLGEHEDRAAVDQLVRNLGDRSADVRLAAAWALGEIKDRDAVSHLIEATKDTDPMVREMAVLALGEIEDPAAVGSLDRLFDRDHDLREAVIWAMGEIGNDDADRARADAFRTLRREARENEEVWAGELDDSLVEIIRPLPISISTLLGRLRSNDAETRRLAAFKLGLFGIMRRPRIIRAVNPLLDTLRDPVPEVRAMAIWSLDEINPSRWRRNSR